MKIRAIDLCSGAGGWAVASRGLPIEIVHAFDWWKPACMTYKMNHPRTSVVQCDLRQPPFDAAALRGRIDLILGGVPCEGLSKYRNWSEGSTVKPEEIERERELLDTILHVVKVIEPTYWCLEDVKGLVKELPPLTPWVEIDSQHFSGQRRKRIYVGDFPPPRNPRNSRDERTLADYLMPGPYRVGTRLYGRTPVISRTFSRDTTLAAHPERKAPTVCAISSKRDSEVGVVCPDLPGGLRQLEWQETARLQGYPDDYLFYGSPTDVASMVGRSVQIDTGRRILQSIVDHWRADTDAATRKAVLQA